MVRSTDNLNGKNPSKRRLFTIYDLSPESRWQILRKFGEETHQLDKYWKQHKGEALTGFFEGQLAYCFARAFKCETIFEIGPKHGWSTYPLALAIKNNGKGKVYSFENLPEAFQITKKNLERTNLLEYVHLMNEDFKLASLPIAEELSGIDMLFVDNGHDDLSPLWYIPNLFPLVKHLVFVHDMTYGTPHQEGKDEKTVISNFLKEHPEHQSFLVKDYVLTNDIGHRINEHDKQLTGISTGGSCNTGIWIKIPNR